MTEEPVTLAELEAAREAIVAAMAGAMPAEHRQFLLGFKRGAPDWNLLGVPGADKLPAVQWKQQNLDRLPVEKRQALIEGLERVLFGRWSDYLTEEANGLRPVPPFAIPAIEPRIWPEASPGQQAARSIRYAPVLPDSPAADRLPYAVRPFPSRHQEQRKETRTCTAPVLPAPMSHETPPEATCFPLTASPRRAACRNCRRYGGPSLRSRRFRGRGGCPAASSTCVPSSSRAWRRRFRQSKARNR